MNNSTYRKIIEKNETDANRVTGNVMLISFALFCLVYILNVVGIFQVDHFAMNIAFFAGSVVLLLPQLLNRIIPMSSKKLKYIYVILAEIFMLIITSTLTHHVVVLYAYPIAIAGLYFSRRLTRFSIIGTILVTVAGQVLGYMLDLTTDDNFYTWYRLIFFSIIPRIITLLCLAALIRLLTIRTSKLLREDADNFEQLELHNRDMIYGFATLVENRDENTGGHIKRTSIYAGMIAEELAASGEYTDIIDKDFISCIKMVAPLHDVGKIAIPDSILCKPGRLTNEEFDIMKTHSARGGEIIRETFSHVADENYRTMAYEIARYHHEKWNGRGYPEGRSENDIPLSARIMAVADVFDAVSEKRCYRDAMPIEECFRIIYDGSGKDFDPVIVEAFRRISKQITDVRINTGLPENDKNQAS